jgi:hypothetical protein
MRVLSWFVALLEISAALAVELGLAVEPELKVEQYAQATRVQQAERIDQAERIEQEHVRYGSLGGGCDFRNSAPRRATSSNSG